jgi:outer membrane protein assembly factor BamB
MVCFDFATGGVKWKERGLGAASLCYADGRLYLHGENGDVALVDPSADTYLEKGRFTPPGQPKHQNQMEKAWAYPVVINGRLLIRDHGCLWCYDVRRK